MSSMTTATGLAGTFTQRTETLFNEQLDANYRRTDRMFAWLMGLQWVAGVAAAYWISPLTWQGQSNQTHLHLWAAMILGALLPSLPLLLIFQKPGATVTRHTVAIAQMLTSGLLVHLSGGRIETHFHYFGSLAFLAFYRDWRVLVTATIIVAGDHLLRGIYWPQSIFGVLVVNHWRWIEHAAWVIFEDYFLFLSIRQNLREMRGVAERQAKLENINETIEQTVKERTSELKATHQRLQEISRQAGMAEVATNVLHNVGNVLNSVNVSSTLVMEGVKKSRITGLARAVGMLKQHEHDLGPFITTDPKGKQLPAYLAQLSDHLRGEQEMVVKELDSLRKNIDHIKSIVAMQQGYAKNTAVIEVLDISELVDDSIRINDVSLGRNGVVVDRRFERIPEFGTQKHKILQILVNLVRNAERACVETGRNDKKITVSVTAVEGRVRISVLDNGVGIPQENMKRIFNQGFTTREDGHGFGLHSAALAAKELGGSLTVRSDGAGQGAEFVLELPMDAAAVPA